MPTSLRAGDDGLFSEQHTIFCVDGCDDPDSANAVVSRVIDLWRADWTVLHPGAASAAGGQVSQGDSAKGWAITMAIFGGLIIIFNLIIS
jgi:hypothetical protein